MLLLRHKPVSDLSIWNVFLEISHSLQTKCFQISSLSCEQKYFSRFPRWEKKPLTLNLLWPILFSLIVQQNSTWVVQQKKKIPILSKQTYETLLKVLKIFKGERHLHPLKEPQLSKRHRLCVVEAQAKQWMTKNPHLISWLLQSYQSVLPSRNEPCEKCTSPSSNVQCKTISKRS